VKTVLAFRIEKEKYLASMLQGLGGKFHSFRWNTKGNPIIYAAESKSLALIEKSGNMSRPSFGIPKAYKLVTLALPDIEFRRISSSNLSDGWDQFDHYAPETQGIGDTFLQSDELALFVPSSIVKGEYNILINPNHKLLPKIKWTFEEVDKRLLDGR